MIRPFHPADFDQIIKIYNSVKLDRTKLGDPLYEASVQKNGFLLGLDTPEDIKTEIEKSYLTLVSENNGQVDGYLIADHGADQLYVDDEFKTWFYPDLKDIYYSSPACMTINTIAVDPTSSQKGIATALYNELLKILLGKNFEYLFSIVSLSPLTNCPTIIWHTRQGFCRFAMSRPRKLFNLENYSGTLLFKKLT